MNKLMFDPISSVSQLVRNFVLVFIFSLSLVACTSDVSVETPADNSAVPTLTAVTISSSNSVAGAAKVGDTITVNITASEAILAPTVLINGNAASSVSGSGANWVATYVVSGADTNGELNLEIGYSDVAGNAGTLVTATTDGSSISIDNGAPVWSLVWSDEFDGTALDSTKWTIQTGDGCAEGICGWGNNEAQIYSANNVSVAGGLLTISGRQEPDNSYTSGRINTKGKMDFKYGRVEVVAKLPFGQGTWPAIWMLPTDDVYGIWPLSGEVDIMEAFNLGVDGSQTVTSTLHYGLDVPENTFTTQVYEPGLSPEADFHTYAIEWELDEIRFYFDDKHYATQISDNWYTYELGSETMAPNSAPFDQAFHLLLNLAIGGNLPYSNGFGIDDSILPQQFQIDSVKVFSCVSSDPANDPVGGQGCAIVDPAVTTTPALSGPSVKMLEVYTNTAPATILTEVNGVTATNTLQPGGFNNGNAAVVSDFDFADPDNAGNSVWHVAIAGDLANVLLTSEDKSTDEILETGFDLMGAQNLGSLLFDMKVNTLSAGTDILIKMDSGFPDVGQVTLASPTVGAWASYEVKISDLIANPAFVDCCGGKGLDLANVLNLFVFEPSNADLAAIDVDVLIDNVRIEVACKNEGSCNAAPKIKPIAILNVFDDAVGTTWDNGIGGFDSATGYSSCFDGGSCGDVVTWAIVNAADAARGQVIDVSHVTGDEIAGIFIQSSTNNNLSAYDGGTLSFDIQVTAAGNNVDGFKIKVDCTTDANPTCSSGEYAIGARGLSGWETVTIPISTLISAGLDTSLVTTGIVVLPNPGQQSGVNYQLDNIFWDIEGSSGTPLSNDPPSAGVTIDGEDPVAAGTDITIYTDMFSSGYSANFFAADGSVNVSEVDATDVSHGKVLQIEALASQQVTWVAANPVLDLSAYAGGTVEFDILVTQMPTDPTAVWLTKSECVGCGAGTELTLGGQTVLSKDTWHHVSIEINSLLLGDLTQVDKPIFVFPQWGKSTGAIYQLDNIRIVAPTTSGPALSSDPSSAGITLNPTSSTSGGMEEVVYLDAYSAGYSTGSFGNDGVITTSEVMATDHGTVVQIENGTTTQAVTWMGADPAVDLTAFANGVLEFDIFVVAAPTDPTAVWRLKIDSEPCQNGCTSGPELIIGGQTLLPPGQWHRVVVDVASLGITDISMVRNIVVFNDWGKAAGSTYQLDNVVWKELKTTSSAKVLYDDALAAGYQFAQFSNQGTDGLTMLDVDSMDAAHGFVIEINNGTSNESVSWVGNTTPGEDLSGFAAGTLDFDFYVATAPNDATADYLVKIETEPCPTGCTATLEYTFGTQADITPGQWYSYSIPMADLGVSDITKFRNVVFFNNWGKAAGTVMRIDNLQFNP